MQGDFNSHHNINEAKKCEATIQDISVVTILIAAGSDGAPTATYHSRSIS